MRLLIACVTLQILTGCAYWNRQIYGYDIEIPIESDPPGVDVYVQTLRFDMGLWGYRHAGLKKFGTTPFVGKALSKWMLDSRVPVIGWGVVEAYAVKNGKILAFTLETASEGPHTIDFSKAVPMSNDESNCIKGTIYVGMAEKYVRLSWGDPHDINSTITKHGKTEQWVYSSQSYVYIEEGKVTAIQN